jgi:hypothetical protein
MTEQFTTAEERQIEYWTEEYKLGHDRMAGEEITKARVFVKRLCVHIEHLEAENQRLREALGVIDELATGSDKFKLSEVITRFIRIRNTANEARWATDET